MATATVEHAHSPQVVQTANDLIAWMSENGNPKWRNELKKTEGGEAAVSYADAALQESGRKEAVVFIGGGTGALKAAYGGNGELTQAAIAALKENGRLIQFGRGRGYALILLDDANLSANTSTKSPSPSRGPNAVSRVNVPKGAAKVTKKQTPASLVLDLQERLAAMHASHERQIQEMETRLDELSKHISA